jgi:hypothetical protein
MLIHLFSRPSPCWFVDLIRYDIILRYSKQIVSLKEEEDRCLYAICIPAVNPSWVKT